MGIFFDILHQRYMIVIVVNVICIFIGLKLLASNIYITTCIYVFIHMTDLSGYILFFDIPYHTKEELLLSSTWNSVTHFIWSPATFLALNWRNMGLLEWLIEGQKNCPDGHVQRVNGLMNNWKCECYLLKWECYPLEAYAWTKIVNIFINKMESETEYTLS